MSLRKCSNCGTEIPENSKFCLECGEKIEIDEFDEEEIEDDIEQEIDLKEEDSYDTRQLDLDMKTKLNIFFRNRTTVIILCIVFAILAISGGLLVYSNVNYSLGIKAINNGDYEKAVEYFENSNKSGSNDMIDMVNTYEDALLDYKYKLYKNVYDKLSLIDKEFPKYKECQKLIDESKKYLIDEKLQEAKDNYSNGEYIEAYDSLKVVLGYEEKQVEALQLQYTYAKQAEQMENTLVEEKAQEEAKIAKKEAEAEKVRKKSEGVRIGMTKQDVLDSSWGAPNDINKTTNEYGTSEQWCYNNYNYLYFEDGILTSIQN